MLKPPPCSVTIWDEHINFPESLLQNWLQHLSKSCRERALGITSNIRRNQFIASRYLLAHHTSSLYGATPEDISSRIAVKENGAPFINQLDVHVTIAHSGPFIATGLSNLARLGVDIEQHRKRHFLRISGAYFHPAEHNQLASMSANNLTKAFYHMWTLKEASAKAKGTGLTSIELNTTPVTISGQVAETKTFDQYTVSYVHHHDQPALWFTARLEKNSKSLTFKMINK